ncbi:MAG: hypothetical protein AAB691_03215 [Patescibacteria group bacterium]
MLSLEQLRKVDPNLSGLTDEEVLEIRDSYYDLGRLMFDVWLDEVGGSKYPVGVLRKLKEGNKIKP